MGKSKIAAKLDIDAYLKTLALGTIKTLGKAALAEVQKERDDVKKKRLYYCDRLGSVCGSDYRWLKSSFGRSIF